MIRHQENDPCETCGGPAHQTCFDCGDPLCEECALALPGFTMLRVCGDCLEKRESKRETVPAAA